MPLTPQAVVTAVTVAHRDFHWQFRRARAGVWYHSRLAPPAGIIPGSSSPGVPASLSLASPGRRRRPARPGGMRRWRSAGRPAGTGLTGAGTPIRSARIISGHVIMTHDAAGGVSHRGCDSARPGASESRVMAGPGPESLVTVA